jgi:hypothetical protein
MGSSLLETMLALVAAELVVSQIPTEAARAEGWDNFDSGVDAR